MLHDNSLHISIFGAGNVTSLRLIPSLLFSGVVAENIKVYGIDSDKDFVSVNSHLFKVHKIKPKDFPLITADSNSLPWIASPPVNARRDILTRLGDQKFVIEKPLGLTKEDMCWIKHNTDLFSRGFVLSYYVLEKWAPLLWLLNILPIPSLMLEKDLIKSSKPLNTSFKNNKVGAIFPNLIELESIIIHSSKITLSEPLTRSLGDKVSSWQIDSGILEFAVHVGVMLYNLQLPYEISSITDTSVIFESLNSSSSASRPSKISKIVTLDTNLGVFVADGTSRSVSLKNDKTNNVLLAINPQCPSYTCLVAYVYDWLNEDLSSQPEYTGDFRAQLDFLEKFFK